MSCVCVPAVEPCSFFFFLLKYKQSVLLGFAVVQIMGLKSIRCLKFDATALAH